MSKLSSHLPLSLGLACALALGFAAISARSQTPASPATAAPSESSSAAPADSAPAAASGSAAPKDMRNLLRGAEIPTEVSEAPKDKKDWDPARTVVPNSGYVDACVFKLIREWLRIECEPRIGGALIAGEPADVKIWSWGDPFAAIRSGAPKELVPKTVIVLPVRRGEAKVLDLALTEESGWDWVGPSSAERISLNWREGSEDPVLVVGRAAR